jgi:hypothetical protein
MLLQAKLFPFLFILCFQTIFLLRLGVPSFVTRVIRLLIIWVSRLTSGPFQPARKVVLSWKAPLGLRPSNHVHFLLSTCHNVFLCHNTFLCLTAFLCYNTFLCHTAIFGHNTFLCHKLPTMCSFATSCSFASPCSFATPRSLATTCSFATLRSFATTCSFASPLMNMRWT